MCAVLATTLVAASLSVSIWVALTPRDGSDTNMLLLWIYLMFQAIVWLWFDLRFFFPAMISICKIGTSLMYNDRNLASYDALGIVRQRMGVLKSDVKTILGWFRA
jgi:hypothetical protein